MKQILQRKIERSYMLALGLLSLFLIVGYFSYAYFTLQIEKEKAVSIITGTLNVEMTINGTKTDKITVSANTTNEYSVVVKNVNNRKARVNLYYLGSLVNNLEVGYVVEDGKNIPPKAVGVTLSANGSETYKIKIKNGTSTSQTINLKADIGLDYNNLSLPNNGHIFEQYKGETFVETLLSNHTRPDDGDYTGTYNMAVFHQTAGTLQKGWTEEELTDYRYIGDEPYNYVTFNNETWRIIGVFTVEDANGNKAKRVKLVREEAIGQWAYDIFSEDYQEFAPVPANNWGYATLNYMLNPEEDYYLEDYHPDEIGSAANGAYWYRKTGSYFGKDNTLEAYDFSKTGLSDTAQNMIDKVKFPVSQIKVSAAGYFAKTLYTEERSSLDPYYESSHVGLISASDYGFASGFFNGEYNCIETDLSKFGGTTPCNMSNWIFSFYPPKASGSWVLSGAGTIGRSVAYIDSLGSLVVDDSSASFLGTVENKQVYPTVYLKPNVKVTGGNGEYGSPFTLSL